MKNFKSITNNIRTSLLLCLLIGFMEAAAQDIDLIQGVFRSAMQSQGKLTEHDHNAFWAELGKMEQNAQNTFLESARVETLGAQEYQLEIWTSIKLSYEMKEVVRTDRLDEIESKLIPQFVEALSFPRDSLESLVAIEQYKKKTKSAASNADILIASAAQRIEDITIGDRRVMLSLGTIESVLQNLSASFTRLDNLLDENWKPESLEAAKIKRELSTETKCLFGFFAPNWPAVDEPSKGLILTPGLPESFVGAIRQSMEADLVPLKLAIDTSHSEECVAKGEGTYCIQFSDSFNEIRNDVLKEAKENLDCDTG